VILFAAENICDATDTSESELAETNSLGESRQRREQLLIFARHSLC
jgi:hypothetical protein